MSDTETTIVCWLGISAGVLFIAAAVVGWFILIVGWIKPDNTDARLQRLLDEREE